MNFLTQIRAKFNRLLRKIKRNLDLPRVVILIGIITTCMYLFSYLFPFTDNAFVVNNVRPVAAQVSGYITHLYVKNGDYVQQGQKLFTVFKPPYKYAVDKLEAELALAKVHLLVKQSMYERDKNLSGNKEKIYIKQDQDDKKYQKGYRNKSVSLITLQNSQQETQAARLQWQAALKQLEIDTHQIEAQKKQIDALKAQLEIAKVNLSLTDVIAQKKGIVQNLFFSVGTPITVNKPLFSLVDIEDVFIQANFNETDLGNVHEGDKVLIFPRMYLGRKMFHGQVVANYWSTNRQLVDARSQLQNVTNENQWILLPQRLPVIIKITDPDPKYPLRVGTSAYVYIKT